MTGWVSVWPPLSPAAWLRRPAEPAPFPLGGPGCRLYRLGRDAVWHGVRALGLSAGDQVLMPAYHAGPEVEALLRAGLDVAFYAGDEDLAPDASELEGLLGPRTRMLSVVHYIGFPQQISRWRSWCDERGILLLEDAAQAWLARGEGGPVGSTGDLALWSVYKTLGTPDGALAVCRAPLPESRGSPGTGAPKLAKLHAAWLGQRRGGVRRLRRGGEPEEFDASAHNELADPDRPAARATDPLLRRLSRPELPEERRRNYRILLGDLSEHVPPPFGELPAGASPWFLPVRTADKRGMIAHLADRGIGAMDFWSVPHPALEVAAFPQVAARRASTIALPVHQELRRRDLARIAAAALDWLER